jgi:hypothetical protein
VIDATRGTALVMSGMMAIVGAGVARRRHADAAVRLT